MDMEKYYGISNEELTNIINQMDDFIETHGVDEFRKAVFNGKFCEVSMIFVHPWDSLRKLKNFKIIHNAFVNAIC